MTTKYVLCQHCNKSNPVEDPTNIEQNCIFCGQPFMISQEKETKLVSEPVNDQKNRITEEVQPNQLDDVNQIEPVNRNKTKPLR